MELTKLLTLIDYEHPIHIANKEGETLFVGKKKELWDIRFPNNRKMVTNIKSSQCSCGLLIIETYDNH